MVILKSKIGFIIGVTMLWVAIGCRKFTSAPPASGVADLTVINAIPNSQQVISVINSIQPIVWFTNAQQIYYQSFSQYSPIGGNDTVYVVQITDTLDVGPKAIGQMYYGILPLKIAGIYSLFLCGADTTAPDYLFTTDTLPYHSPSDSTVGIRFVNLSTGSDPISVNLEGSPNGSEVANLAYKGITGFKDYICNSSVTNGGYIFVFRDATTGDSLAYYSLPGFGNSNGVGLQDQVSGEPLIFKNVTIAFIGQPGANAVVPQSTMFIDDY